MAGILVAVALYSVNRQKSFMESCSKELKASLQQAQEVKCDLEEIMLNTINMSRELVDDLERRLKIDPEPVSAMFTADQTLHSESSMESQLPDSPEKSGGARTKAILPAVVLNPGASFPEKVAGPKLFNQKTEAGYGAGTIPAALFNSKTQLTDTLKSKLPESQTNSDGSGSQRVHELADELKTSSKELLTICQQLGLGINHHMRVLSPPQIEAIKAQWFFGEPLTLQKTQTQPSFQTEIVSVSNPSQEKMVLNNVGFERGQQFSIEEIKQAHPYLAVRTLSEQGYDLKEIARILGRGQSEVNLIINLTKRKMASNA